MESGEVLMTLLVAVVMVIGLCGVILPFVPGLALMWAAALVYGLVVGWGAIGVVVMVVLSILVAVGFVAGLVVPRRAAAEAGASGMAQLGGLIGAIVGFFLIPVVGVIVGALVGVLVVEYATNDGWEAAWAATIGTARGFGVSILIDLAIGLVMLTAWSIWAATVLF